MAKAQKSKKGVRPDGSWWSYESEVWMPPSKQSIAKAKEVFKDTKKKK